MKTGVWLAGWWLVAMLTATPAAAHHVVWLDFGGFNLTAYPTVNGNTPPTAADVAAVQTLVVANMVQDYAPFDIHFTLVQPSNGRFSRIRFQPWASGNSFGEAGICAGCTGLGSWDEGASYAEVYAGTPPAVRRSQWLGANATTARIANTLSHTASHELGHLLGLSHCYSANDFQVALGCGDGFAPTLDANVNWHVMASGASTALTQVQRATRDRFFSVYASRRALYRRLQARNHWAPLPNLNGDLGLSDLLYANLQSPPGVQWDARRSNGSAFGGLSTWSSAAGTSSDIFLTGDVDGDGQADLVYGRALSSTTMRWFVRLSTGSAFGTVSVWASDAGNPGDIFRLGDVNGDGRVDLVYGRPLGGGIVSWFVRLSTGSGFGGQSLWASDVGNQDSLFLVGDVTGNGRADLVAVNRGSGGGVAVYRSTGSAFVFEGINFGTAFQSFLGNADDYVMLGDADGDGRADLVAGNVVSNARVDWFVWPSNGCVGVGGCFGSPEVWAVNGGDAGDLFRLGDGNGDGQMDLFYGRPVGLTSLTNAPNLALIRWFGRLSTGSEFDPGTVWRNDAGNEGALYP